MSEHLISLWSCGTDIWHFGLYWLTNKTKSLLSILSILPILFILYVLPILPILLTNVCLSTFRHSFMVCSRWVPCGTKKQPADFLVHHTTCEGDLHPVTPGIFIELLWVIAVCWLICVVCHFTYITAWPQFSRNCGTCSFLSYIVS